MENIEKIEELQEAGKRRIATPNFEVTADKPNRFQQTKPIQKRVRFLSCSAPGNLDQFEAGRVASWSAWGLTDDDDRLASMPSHG